MCAFTNAAGGHRTTGHDLQRISKPSVGIFRDDDRTLRPLLAVHRVAVGLRDHQNAGLRSLGFVTVLGLRQKGNGIGCRMIERCKRAHSQIFGSAQRRTCQSPFGERFDFTDQSFDSEHSVIS